MPDSTGLTSWSDVKAAEKLLDEAIARRDALNQPDGWQAHESLDPEGRRHVHFNSGHFEMLERADQGLQRARDRVVAVRRAWAGLDARGL
jgi:hypothetical protein